MGVPGLWSLLKPAGNSLELHQLSGKVVAIDMNIWLYQAVKSSTTAGSSKNYLAILFHRLCKLLYFGIHPVFVFDGQVSIFKRTTMAIRRGSRARLNIKAEQAQKRLLVRLLKRLAEEELKPDSRDKKSPTKRGSFEQELVKRLQQRGDLQQAKLDEELFALPSLTTPDTNGNLLHETAGLEHDELARDFLDGYHSICEKPWQVDLHSEVFCELPLGAQLRVVQLIREILDSSTHSNILNPMENDFTVERFSSDQMQRLLLRRRLSERQHQLSTEISKQEALKQLQLLNQCPLMNKLNLLMSDPSALEHSANELTVMRIQSRASGHAVLIKQNHAKLTPTSGDSALDSLIRSGSEESNNHSSTTDPTYTLSDNSMSMGNESSQSIAPTIDDDEVSRSIDQNKDNETDFKISSLNDDDSSTVAFNPISTHIIDANASVVASADDSGQMGVNLIEKSNVYATDKTRGSDSTSKSSVPVETLFTIYNAESVNPHNREGASRNLSVGDVPGINLVKDELINEASDDDDDFVEVSTIDSNHDDVDGFDKSPTSSPIATDDDLPCSASPTSEASSAIDDKLIQSIDDSHVPNFDANLFIEDEKDDVLRDQADRFTKQAQTITTRCVEEVQELLRLFGFPYLTSPEEAEAQCVALQHLGLVDLVASDDSDVWPFGVHAVCRYLFGSGAGRGKRKSDCGPCLYHLTDVNKLLGLNLANLIRLTLLCGSDYTTGIDQVGVITAMEVISEFVQTDAAMNSTIDQWMHGRSQLSDEIIQFVLEPLKQFADWLNNLSSVDASTTNTVRRKWSKLNAPKDFPQPNLVRAYLHPNVHTDVGKFEWAAPDVKSIIKHMQNMLNWHPTQTEATLHAVLKQRTCSHTKSLSTQPPRGQPTLHKYFKPSDPDHNAVKKRDSKLSGNVNFTSKRARYATSRLRTRNRTEDANPEIDQLSKPDKPKRTRSTKKTSETSKAENKPQQNTTQNKMRKSNTKMFVKQVNLSESDSE